MKRSKAKQTELFTPDEMKGGVKPRDRFEEEYVQSWMIGCAIYFKVNVITLHLKDLLERILTE